MYALNISLSKIVEGRIDTLWNGTETTASCVDNLSKDFTHYKGAYDMKRISDWVHSIKTISFGLTKYWVMKRITYAHMQ